MVYDTSPSLTTFREQDITPTYVCSYASQSTFLKPVIDLDMETLKKYFESLASNSIQVQSEQIVIPKQIEQQIDNVFHELNYSNETAKSLAVSVVKEMLASGFYNFKISRTGEGEFLIYVRSVNGSYKNLLIDEDGDIELIFLPKKREKTWNQIFFREDGLFLSRIISAFNGMY